MIIKKGSRGLDVTELQKALNALGYNCGTADGIFGRGTELQVEHLQEAVHIHPDGIVGKGTMREINELLEREGHLDLKFELGDHPDPDPRSSCCGGKVGHCHPATSRRLCCRWRCCRRQ